MSDLPSAVLDTPYPQEAIPSTLNEVLGLGDWLSPAHWLVAGIDFVFGFNPGEEVGRWVAGDWRSVATAASAYGQLAEYAERLGADLYDGSQTMLEQWTGNAATSAGTYFEKLALAINSLAPNLQGIAQEFQTVVAGMQEFATAVGSILEMLLDKLIEIGMKAAAGTLLSETGVGALVFGGWAAYDAYKATHLWMQAVEWQGRAITLSQGVVGLTAGYLGALQSLDSITIPNAYNHPGAQR